MTLSYDWSLKCCRGLDAELSTAFSYLNQIKGHRHQVSSLNKPSQDPPSRSILRKTPFAYSAKLSLAKNMKKKTALNILFSTASRLHPHWFYSPASLQQSSIQQENNGFIYPEWEHFSRLTFEMKIVFRQASPQPPLRGCHCDHGLGGRKLHLGRQQRQTKFSSGQGPELAEGRKQRSWNYSTLTSLGRWHLILLAVSIK